MIRKFHEAKENNHTPVTLWGTGTPMREFLYVDDMAEACIHVMNVEKEKWDSVTEPMRNFVNLGSGYDVSIADFAKIVAEVIDFRGELVYDISKPDGTMSKLTDNSKINSLGWYPRVELKDGLNRTYEWYLNGENR
jgi:GDP-L-fucose synthase